ncbi:MAG: PAC2 family protein [Candidatus Thorarchaeota archaeon]|nr:MAG: PAC2 family protein [Candidatus Thorarchaeota archaeon]
MYKRKFIDVDESTLKKPVAIVGLPGIANVGRVAVESLVESLDAVHFMDFFSDDFPPRVIVKDGISEFPTSSMYLYRAAPDEPNDVILLTAEYQPSSGQGVFAYADFVAQEFAKIGVLEVFAVAAYEQGYEDFLGTFPAGPRVYVSASSQDLLRRITAIDGFAVAMNGVINGANGVIPAWAASMYNMESACLLGETMGVIKMDFRAAKAVLDKLGQLIGLKTDFAFLDERVLKVIQFIEWARDEVSQKGSRSDTSESPPDRYIG